METCSKIKNFYCLIFTLLLFFFLSKSVLALDASRPNNKFGIHLAQPGNDDIKRAADLVNSSGGKWGYVTLVIQENDRDTGKWQDVFNELRSLHLIPIIRLATEPEGAKWKRPRKEEAEAWAKFLDSLNWVVKERYVVLFNEPNQGQEWGGEVDADSYADVAKTYGRYLKEKNKDFFIMLSGFDAASPSHMPWYEDEATFLKKIKDYNNVFDVIDGWASHSYPNHGFIGTPYDNGRNSIRNYQWELDYLKSIGVSKDLPVFITETGWPHREAASRSGFYSSDVAGAYTEIAYKNAWLTDDRVRAVTPFVLNYQGEPFLQFSWVKPGEKEVYPHYLIVKNIVKQEGDPEIIDRGMFSYWLPKELLVKSTYHFSVQIKNEGQAIWDRDEGYALKLDPSVGEAGLKLDYFFADLKDVRPGDEQEVDLYLKTGDRQGDFRANLGLYKGDRQVMKIASWNFRTRPLPRLEFKVGLLPKFNTNASDFEVQIFDRREQIVFKKKGVSVRNGRGIIDNIQNIALGEKYRIVILKPYYLPRQTFITFKKEANEVEFKSMIPLDFDRDGHLDWQDAIELFRNQKLLNILIPSF